ncbi:hypothetical protein M8818_003065 [Zalaria obscura]|uniref:Uncharacterized protein n=1 Tax=Zalaria obscura TaxID=2024903 RepID=A0ACC3SFT6_9PEZI
MEAKALVYVMQEGGTDASKTELDLQAQALPRRKYALGQISEPSIGQIMTGEKLGRLSSTTTYRASVDLGKYLPGQPQPQPRPRPVSPCIMVQDIYILREVKDNETGTCQSLNYTIAPCVAPNRARRLQASRVGA